MSGHLKLFGGHWDWAHDNMSSSLPSSCNALAAEVAVRVCLLLRFLLLLRLPLLNWESESEEEAEEAEEAKEAEEAEEAEEVVKNSTTASDE